MDFVAEDGGWRCKSCAATNPNPKQAIVRTHPNTTALATAPAASVAVASWQSTDDIYDPALI
jgi:hypothetical protein